MTGPQGVPDPAVPGVVLYQGVPLREGGEPPRWGCSLVAHQYLGWCSRCPGVGSEVEAVGWRLWAGGHGAPDVVWARAVAAGRT